jgi:hypothetical protein
MIVKRVGELATGRYHEGGITLDGWLTMERLDTHFAMIYYMDCLVDVLALYYVSML